MEINPKIYQVIELLNKAVVSDIVVYNMKEVTPFYDYSIVASATNQRQALAAMNHLRSDAASIGLKVLSFSGGNESRWCLVDLGLVVVHIFVLDERSRFNLDGLYCQLEHCQV